MEVFVCTHIQLHLRYKYTPPPSLGSGSIGLTVTIKQHKDCSSARLTCSSKLIQVQRKQCTFCLCLLLSVVSACLILICRKNVFK